MEGSDGLSKSSIPIRPPDRPKTPAARKAGLPVLRVDVQGSEIVITASDSDYMMTYHKPANSLGFSLNTSLGRKTGVSL